MPPFAAAVGPLAALPSAEAAEAARADQHVRWAAGDLVPAERYLAALPAVAANPADALVLVYGEVLLRGERGLPADVDAIAARFPQYRDALVPLFDVHHGLDFAPESVPPPPIPGYDRLVAVGHGGMGTVYRGRDASGTDVAVKVMRAGAAAGTAEVVRFLQEADVLARLSHPNVVGFLGRGVADGVPYLVTEWVAGGSLADRITPHPADPEWAAGVVRGAARGLAAAHAVGVIHRDVKPANILLAGPGDLAKVADFGLARLAACGGTLTASAEVIGTRRYMPHEQLDGHARDVGPWSDLFSLGAVLYELLAGRPAFADVERDTPPLLAETVPPRLWAACARALRPVPRDRFQTAAEFLAAVESA